MVIENENNSFTTQNTVLESIKRFFRTKENGSTKENQSKSTDWYKTLVSCITSMHKYIKLDTWQRSI